MKSFTIVSFLAFATYVTAQANGGPPFDPAGTKNVGNGAGGQFIGGQCLSDADCGSGCCAGPSGICSGVGAQTQAGKTGCGFSSSGAAPAPAAAATSPAAAAPPAAAAGTASAGGPPFDPAGAKNVGNGAGGQFIGGQCLSGADCGSGCCAGPSGICSGVGAQTQAGKTGCGFVSGAAPAPAAAAATSPAAAPVAATTAAAAAPAGTQFITGACTVDADCASTCCGAKTGTCNALAVANGPGGGGCGGKGAAAAAPAAAPAAAVAGTASAGGPPFDPSGAKNVGNGAGGQFIGGQCLSAADCGSGCCAGPSGICSGVGAQTQAGKTGCGFVSKRFIARSRSFLL